MRELIFVDTESTGLSHQPDTEMVELTWATLDGEPETLWFGVKEVPEFIDDLIGFTERNLSGRISDFWAFDRFLEASYQNVMVAANPAHDKHFIEQAGLWQFHYRMLDIETYAMAKLNLKEVPSMAELTDNLRNAGYDITVPDHTSRNDVLAMRDAYKVLEAM